MAIQTIDITLKYNFERITQSSGERDVFLTNEDLRTVYLHSGSVMLGIQNKTGELEKMILKAGEGFVVFPETRYILNSMEAFIAYQVSSEVRDKPIIEIIDDGETMEEVLLEGYKLIKNPKKVEKPWGQELWIVWTKNHHVMKQITMNAGNQSSLQFHREKLETNYLQEGEAEVIDGYQLDPQAPEEEVQTSSKDVNFNQYKKRLGPGDSWTSHPGTVHRVIATKDYVAYEVSTPEMDDVIRLQDDSNRVSGRINSEHNQ